MIQLANLIQDPANVQITAIRTGIAAIEAENLVRDYRFARFDVANLLNLTLSAFQHRVRLDLRLGSVASERLLRLARIANHATGVFSDSISAGDWLTRPHTALGQVTPISMLDTAYGGQEVERILCSIEYGLPV